MNILITSASRKVNLVMEFQKALANIDEGGKVIAVDSSPLAPALYFADEYYIVPSLEDPNYILEIGRLCSRLCIKLIVPTRDGELLFYAERKEGFYKKLGTRVMVASPATIRICQDKHLFNAWCRSNQFFTPTEHNTFFPEFLSYPVFIKPRWGKDPHFCHRVDTAQELRSLRAQNPKIIVQDYITTPEYTMDLFADFDGNILSVVPRERIRIVGGESFIGRTLNNPLLITEAMRLAKKLKLIGHNTIQAFLDHDRVKFIEVNARFGGGAALGFESGVRTPTWLVELLQGKKIEPRIGQFREGLFMLRYTSDVFATHGRRQVKEREAYQTQWSKLKPRISF